MKPPPPPYSAATNPQGLAAWRAELFGVDIARRDDGAVALDIQIGDRRRRIQLTAADAAYLAGLLTGDAGGVPASEAAAPWPLDPLAEAIKAAEQETPIQRHDRLTARWNEIDPELRAVALNDVLEEETEEWLAEARELAAQAEAESLARQLVVLSRQLERPLPSTDALGAGAMRCQEPVGGLNDPSPPPSEAAARPDRGPGHA